MKDHGAGLQAMAGLIPESTVEEGDESIKIQVKDTTICVNLRRS